MAKLMTFQQEGLDIFCKLYSARKELNITGLYNGDEPGLGKTITAIAFSDFIKAKRVLIIVPSPLKLNWESEIREHLPDLTQFHHLKSNVNITIRNVLKSSDLNRDIMNGGISTLFTIISFGILIQEKIFKFLAKQSWDLVVVDEAHCLASSSSKRTKAVKALTEKKAKFSMLLSGTPLKNTALDLFPQCQIVDRFNTEFSNWFKFAEKYCHKKPASYKDNGFQYFGGKNLEELGKLMRSRFFIRRTKEQVLKDLPERQLIKIELEVDSSTIAEAEEIFKALNGDQGLKYDLNTDHKVLSSLENKLDELNEGSLVVPKDLIKQHMYNRQILGLAKVKAGREFIENILEQDISLGIFAHFQASIKALTEIYKKYNPVKFDGSTTKTAKQHAIESFNAGNTNLFIGQLQAASVGINLQHACSTCLFIENNYSAVEIMQAIDRFRRIGQKNCVTAYFFVAKDNKLDRKIVKAIIDKEKMIHKTFGD